MKTRTTDRPRPTYRLTEAQVTQLRALDGRAPDTNDIPSAPEANWATAVRGKHHAAMREALTVRLDADVLAWLRAQGPDCGAAVNRILRERMEAEAVT